MFNISNLNPFSTHRTETLNGKEYLVVRGAPIVEGVLNKFLAPMEEFAAFVKDWDGVPIVLRHPQQNDGSARVPSPDVPVLGQFYGAALDTANRRLIGEYWFDKDALLAHDEGKKIHDNILAGKIIETSTGYYANIDNVPGVHKGLSYIGTQREIHPDHIAVLPDEVGACSVLDGCGINRNSSVIANCEGCVMNMMGNLPTEAKKMWEKVHKKALADGDSEEMAAKKAWGACKRAGWMKKGDGWVKKNYAIFDNAQAESDPDYSSQSMIAFMLPDAMKDTIKEKFPFITDEVYNNLHLTLAFLGESEGLNTIQVLKSMFDVGEYQPHVAGKVQGIARFISGGDQDAIVLTFDSSDLPKLYERLSNNLDWKGIKLPSEHGFIPHITLAYIGKDDEIPVDTFEPFDMTITDMSLVNGDDVFLKVPFAGAMGGYVNVETAYNVGSQAPSRENWLVNLFHNQKKENPKMDEFKQLVQQILNKAGWNVTFDDKGKTASATPAATLSPTLTGLESVVNEAGGVEKFAELLKSLNGIPASIQGLTDSMKTIEEGVKAATEMAQNASKVAAEKKTAVIGRLVANTANPLDEATLNLMGLEALEKLEASYRPTNYAGLGGWVQNATADDDILEMPSLMVNAAQAKVS